MTALIDHIQRFVVIDGKCWEWQGAVHSSGPTPVTRFGGKVVMVRRELAVAAGMPLEGRVTTTKCGNPLCVNPAHVTTATRRELSLQAAATHKRHASPLTRKKIADRGRARSKLTLEQAQEIREATGSQREIAARYGVDQKTVWLIKQGRAWIDYSNPFSQLMGGLKK